MKAFTRDGTPVECEIGGDGPDDLQILSAEFVGESRSGYANRGRNVTEADCAWIERNFHEQMYFDWLENQIGRAEDLYDACMDR